ncbi:phosphotransferase family protein [Paenibacillus thiaminolyticus]|uniref:Aminoglycoside phosphotransferase family protein n=1 Tax=Paenibacillus thiaminolyticus TaxID=49283 RepID=A0A3A3GG50_PANTH|nr:aminoglycoside phosphotransferase family protein [Paenibacillus thiaminolyticus]RJG22839.1 aminoglycoside phosphotransferase family protein [Paenibacillus thiaminolyticus]
MTNLIREIDWLEISSEVRSLLDQGGSCVTIHPMKPGLEAEVTRISMDELHFVLKVWNRDSKPDVRVQYKLLEALYNRGLPVSKPYGWGLDRDENSVLLTSFDGSPIKKANQSLFKAITEMLTRVHRIPLQDIDEFALPKHDFISYFYPGIEEHVDLRDLLVQLVECADMKQDCMIHGDFNLGNVLEAEGKYTIIDWTNGQLGDPRYDMAWSMVLMKIYGGTRPSSHLLSAILKETSYTSGELELFEAMACLRWILLHRMAFLPTRKGTISRVRSLLKGNRHLNEDLL